MINQYRWKNSSTEEQQIKLYSIFTMTKWDSFHECKMVQCIQINKLKSHIKKMKDCKPYDHINVENTFDKIQHPIMIIELKNWD